MLKISIKNIVFLVLCRVIIFMFLYSENIAHFKGGISYEVQKSFYLVVQVVAASIVATSIITA